ncbi:carbohydrate kinase family protein [Chelativorans sp. Marseille-P2723]|uniref:carbohydrate kinase family protein n=1 Tax=Chelativorans sp. Marseille-P2723 TaxID=2709133 RepID=UPI00156F1A71|nr:carbohydrate kinase family protein [Chelativorans sp. Marseille-P2723]
MKRPHLFASGGAHMDRRGKILGPHVPEASNPGAMTEEPGGSVFNAARAAAQRGCSVSLLSLRGGDAAGERVAEAIEAAGIEDLSANFLDRATPSYTAILTEQGDLVTALADMQLYEAAFAKQLRRRKLREAAMKADAVLCDANMPADAIAQLLDLAGDKWVYAIAVSPAKVGRLLPMLARFSCVFMNRGEACALTGISPEAPNRHLARELVAKVARSGVVTAGSASAFCFEGNTVLQITPPSIGCIRDVTGAGDALAGAAIAALMRGLPLAEAVREGMAAARLTLESETAAPRFDKDAFREALALIPQPGEATDRELEM